MRVKLLFVALILSNVGWLVAYRTIDQARKLNITWLQDAQKDRNFWQDQAKKLNDDISHLCRCHK